MKSRSNKTAPATLGYSMPPEWSRHAATLMHWPSNRETWPGERLPPVEKVYLDIIEALHQYEPVHLITENDKIRERAKNLLDQREINWANIEIYSNPINDVWCRDCGPIFIERNMTGKAKFAITNWGYNAWGEKYPPYDNDNRIPEFIARKFDLEIFEPDMVLEGGSIDINGNGVLLTTESVLLNENRNPDHSKNEIEKKLKDFLGVSEIVWLKKGLAGDDTDGHIDDLARFLNNDTILAMDCNDPRNINYDALKENLEILRNAKTESGKSYFIETLPLPETRIEGTTVDGSEFVPASYANFYIANGVVLVPLYDERYDEKALNLFTTYFPDRDVIGIPCADLVWGQGSIHCITQQMYGI